jgi:hypothetical protein
MFHARSVAQIPETTGEATDDVQPPLHFPQQQPAAVAARPLSLKAGYHRTRKMICKPEPFLGTLCHSEGRSPL